MSDGRLEWEQSTHSQIGRAGKIRLFSIHYGYTRQAAMWTLATDLPIKSESLGQHYATPEDAKVAAERILAAFLARVGGES